MRLLLILTACLLAIILVFSLFKNDTARAQSLNIVDKDGDGVWDDIQKAITTNYKDPDLISAQRQIAKAMQKAILKPADAFNINNELFLAESCLCAVKRRCEDDLEFVEENLINNSARSYAYIKFNAVLSGHLLKGYSPSRSNCK